jgi:hypothetical protein
MTAGGKGVLDLRQRPPPRLSRIAGDRQSIVAHQPRFCRLAQGLDRLHDAPDTGAIFGKMQFRCASGALSEGAQFLPTGGHERTKQGQRRAGDGRAKLEQAFAQLFASG